MKKVLLSWLAWMALTIQASAHAFLVTADPPVGGTVNASLSAVTIGYTEELEPRFSSLTVEDDAGNRVDRDDAHTDPKDATQFIVDLKPLRPGLYKVVWHATSVDTHKTNGSYTFTWRRKEWMPV